MVFAFAVIAKHTPIFAEGKIVFSIEKDPTTLRCRFWSDGPKTISSLTRPEFERLIKMRNETLLFKSTA